MSETQPVQPTIEEMRGIILSEYNYWSKAPPEIGMAAAGACANLLAALMGHRAPWHPERSKEPEPCYAKPYGEPIPIPSGFGGLGGGHPPPTQRKHPPLTNKTTTPDADF